MEFSFEEFKKISKGDVVFFGENEKGIMDLELTSSVTIEGSREQIYLSDLRPPYVIKKTPVKEEVLAATLPIKKSVVIATKVKSAETIKLENLLNRYPDDEKQIMSEALTGKLTIAQIESGLVMQKAGERLRA